MPRRSTVVQLPDELRKKIDRMLEQSGFSGYEWIAQNIEQEHDVKISKSALHRYGQQLEERLADIRDSTRAAQAIAEAAGDEPDHRLAASISLVQSEMFKVLLALKQIDDDAAPEERLKPLFTAAMTLNKLGVVSLQQKKHESQVLARAAENAAALAETAARRAGLSDDGVEAMRAAILTGLSE
jgi:hypothetical protein